jgi:hypothetical protein
MWHLTPSRKVPTFVECFLPRFQQCMCRLWWVCWINQFQVEAHRGWVFQPTSRGTNGMCVCPRIRGVCVGTCYIHIFSFHHTSKGWSSIPDHRSNATLCRYEKTPKFSSWDQTPKMALRWKNPKRMKTKMHSLHPVWGSIFLSPLVFSAAAHRWRFV